MEANIEGGFPADAVKKHKKYFVDGDSDQADSRSLGAAAAMQALKKFNSGEEDHASGKSEGKFLALAMAEASKVRFAYAPGPGLSRPPLKVFGGSPGLVRDPRG